MFRRAALYVVAIGIISFIGLYAWKNVKSADSITPIEGGIVIRRLRCEAGAAGVHRVWIAGLNQTNRHLRNVRVEFSVGHRDEVSTESAEIVMLPEGGTFELTQEVPYNGEIDVCYVKFFRGSQQLASTFRP